MTAILRKIWPSSLYRQILLVVALALLVAQGINATMFFMAAQSRAKAEAATWMISRVVNHAERQADRGLKIDEAGPPENRRPMHQVHRRNIMSMLVANNRLDLQGFNLESGLAARATEFFRQADLGIDQVQLATGPAQSLPPKLADGLMRGNYARRLHQMRQPLPQQAILLSARLADGRWVHSAALLRPRDRGAIWALFLQTITLYIAVLIPLALIARRIVKPLEKLRRRVQNIGFDGEIAPLEREGPSDIRTLIDSFNVMQERVATLLGEKDIMLGAIGHDLKTPLAALRVRIESIDDDVEREKMANSVDEMVTILDDILMLARLGKSGEALQKTNVSALIGDVVTEFSDGGADVSLVLSCDPVILNIRPVLIRRALRNIIGNAVHYGNSATVHIEQTRRDVAIMVDDKGPGIAPDMAEHMFEPFARAERSRNRQTGGSGLGLTIARAIIRSHGGDIQLANRAEGGLRATMKFPLN